MKAYHFDDEQFELRRLKSHFIHAWEKLREIVQKELRLNDPGELVIEQQNDGRKALAEFPGKLEDIGLLIGDLIDMEAEKQEREKLTGVELARMAREQGRGKKIAILAISRADQEKGYVGSVRRKFEQAARLPQAGDRQSFGCGYINKGELPDEGKPFEEHHLTIEELARLMLNPLIDAGVIRVPFSTIIVPVDDLHFDPFNYRLAGMTLESQPRQGDDAHAEREFYRDTYWEHFDAEELARSMVALGPVWDTDRMYAREKEGRLVVMEGNRRLAAITGILDPIFCDQKGIRADTEIRSKLSSVPVVILPAKESPENEAVQAFIDFKHINSSKRWSNYAKATAINRLIEDLRAQAGNAEKTVAEIYEEASRRVGDTSNTVPFLHEAWLVLEQAGKKQNGKVVFDLEERANSPGMLDFDTWFAVLEHAGVREFLGLLHPLERSIGSDPVPPEKLENLARLCEWVFGRKSKDKDPIIKDPIIIEEEDIEQLGELLLDPDAVYDLQHTRKELWEFWEGRSGATARMTDHLRNARIELKAALILLKRGCATNIIHSNQLEMIQKVATDCGDLALRIKEKGQHPVAEPE